MFAKGDKVVLSALQGKIGIIDGDPRETKGRLFYPVSIDPSQPSSYYPEDSLREYSPLKSVEQLLMEREFSTAEDFIQSLIHKKFEKPLSDNLYTFYSSRTEFQVHQFKPVLKFINTMKQRLLLADEVGLGKTIEAGIILTELSARLDSLSRVLIVCPSMLAQKWETEMQKRFNLPFTILRRDDFLKFLRLYDEYGAAQKLKGIISLQTIRASRVTEKMRQTAPHFDITIIDEAHHMRNPETMSSEAGEALSELSDAMLLLSATPLQLGTPDLFNLLGILIPEEFADFALFDTVLEPNEHLNNALHRLYDPEKALKVLKAVEGTSQRDRFLKNSYYQEALELLSNNRSLNRTQAIRLQKLLSELNCLSYVFTRTKKRDIEVQFPVREARVLRVTFTREEKHFYNAVTDFVAERFTESHGSSRGISFAIIMPQRQVASCIQAMRENLDRIIKKRVIRGPHGDDGDFIDISMDEESQWELSEHEVSGIRTLKSAAEKVGRADSKFDCFLMALRELEAENPASKIMVFAFFKGTIEYLRRRLEATEYRGELGVIHGDIIVKDRMTVIKRFRSTSDIKILLTSEVGGEGLDFEFCNVIFNYDLPWNPMRVEQRIGRLDRYGQRHEKILIYNFSMVGTIDDIILTRLYSRINVFEKYIGDLDAIIGDQITEMTKEMFNSKLSEEQRQAVVDKVAENIERKQRELEEFEAECQKFIGQDEYFNQEITRIKETKRFITSEEVRFLLEIFLKKNFPKSSMSTSKDQSANVYILKIDENFRRFIIRSQLDGDNTAELERKMTNETGMLLTFSDQEACRDDSLEFITIHHPIMKAIKRYYDENKQDIHSTARLMLEGATMRGGRYFFFVYLIQRNALRTELILVPVLISLSSNEVHIVDELCDWFLAEVVNAKDNGKETSDYSDGDFRKYLKEAGEYLEMIREEEEQKVRRSNDMLINNQIESVRQATMIKIAIAKSIIERRRAQGKEDSDSIIKLHSGRVRNLTLAMEEKVANFERRRSVSVGFSLIAGGIVDIKATEN
jgi:SNF2 family DNA or RNA helicase